MTPDEWRRLRAASDEFDRRVMALPADERMLAVMLEITRQLSYISAGVDDVASAINWATETRY